MTEPTNVSEMFTTLVGTLSLPHLAAPRGMTNDPREVPHYSCFLILDDGQSVYDQAIAVARSTWPDADAAKITGHIQLPIRRLAATDKSPVKYSMFSHCITTPDFTDAATGNRANPALFVFGTRVRLRFVLYAYDKIAGSGERVRGVGAVLRGVEYVGGPIG
jgi:hypothetical protein